MTDKSPICPLCSRPMKREPDKGGMVSWICGNPEHTASHPLLSDKTAKPFKSNDVVGFFQALAASEGTVEINCSNGIIRLETEQHIYDIDMDWLTKRVLVPIEITDDALTQGKRQLLVMRCQDGFTWNDYVRNLWNVLVRPHLPPPQTEDEETTSS